MTSPSLGTKIIEEIAARKDIDPIDLDTQLYDDIDVDALERIFEDAGQRDLSVSVEFETNGYSVTVEGTDAISLSPAPEAEPIAQD